MIAIRVAGLSKQYRLGETDFGRRSLYHALGDRLAGRPRTRRPEGPETIWALDDVSFEVATGEAVGVIGANGAGKSTLLKLLSRITSPTRGRAEYYGRLASLLEVGTGFHGELTGRDNIFLNGAILGMSRAEIASKFDSIVDFSGVEEFLDTPVKRYSSGMQVRLAFSVAAHIDPDILIVDEVLAVGDSAFRAKCLDRLDETARSGRTVLLVSHDLAAIEGMTKRCLLLKRGLLAADGPTLQVVAKYLSSVEREGEPALDDMEHLGTGDVRIREVRICGPRGSAAVASGSELEIVVEIDCPAESPSLAIDLGIYDHLGRHLLLLDSEASRGRGFTLPRGRSQVSCGIERLALPPGRYSVSAAVLRSGVLLDAVPRCRYVAVEAGDYYGTGRLPAAGLLLADCRWSDGVEVSRQA